MSEVMKADFAETVPFQQLWKLRCDIVGNGIRRNGFQFLRIKLLDVSSLQSFQGYGSSSL